MKYDKLLIYLLIQTYLFRNDLLDQNIKALHQEVEKFKAAAQ